MSLVGCAGEVVLHVLGLTRHISSMALLVYILSFLPQVLTASLSWYSILIRVISYQDWFPADSTEKPRIGSSGFPIVPESFWRRIPTSSFFDLSNRSPPWGVSFLDPFLFQRHSGFRILPPSWLDNFNSILEVIIVYIRTFLIYIPSFCEGSQVDSSSQFYSSGDQ